MPCRAIAHPAPADGAALARHTVEEYFGLVGAGVLGADDRVELLEQNPKYATGVQLARKTLERALGDTATVRVQARLLCGAHSVPEPDVAVVPGTDADYGEAHPTTALLVVEVAGSSLVQDRLTKAAIYAAAGVPEFWLVNLVADRLEVFRTAVPAERRYTTTWVPSPGARVELAAVPGVVVAVDDLLPRRP